MRFATMMMLVGLLGLAGCQLVSRTNGTTGVTAEQSAATTAADDQKADKDQKVPAKKVLFYSQSCGFRHGPVTRPLDGGMAYAEKALKKFLPKAGYEVFVSQDPHDLDNPDKYKQYDAIIFYTSGNPPIHRDGFLKWLKEGGAFVGVHSATDTFRGDIKNEGVIVTYGWPEFIDIIGGAFVTHGPGGRTVTMKIEDPDHPAVKMLPQGWQFADEFYHHNRFSRDNVHVLMSVDKEKTNLAEQKMAPDGDYPMAWTNTYGQGRMFYTALGHFERVWDDPQFQQHLLGGLAWALKTAE